jgi:hypothetical protein
VGLVGTNARIAIFTIGVSFTLLVRLVVADADCEKSNLSVHVRSELALGRGRVKR